MKNTIKQVCLYIVVVTLILLLRTFPDPIIAWVDEHYGFVWVISTIAWVVYCERDNNAS